LSRIFFHDAAQYTRGIKPENMWNMDESGFHMEHDPAKIVCKKGVRAVNSRVSSSRENVTVVACTSAAGEVMPPMFIVKGKTYKSLRGFQTTDAPAHSRWTFQAKAWMEDALGVEWFVNVFLKHCGPDRPQVLFLDQHHSHEVFELLEIAKRQNIHIVAFPPHSSHWLQPLDMSCFASLSKSFRSICSEFMAQSKS
jgi:hypothetical protein